MLDNINKHTKCIDQLSNFDNGSKFYYPSDSIYRTIVNVSSRFDLRFKKNSRDKKISRAIKLKNSG